MNLLTPDEYDIKIQEYQEQLKEMFLSKVATNLKKFRKRTNWFLKLSPESREDIRKYIESCGWTTTTSRTDTLILKKEK